MSDFSYIKYGMSDLRIQQKLGASLKKRRLELNKTQSEIAKSSGVARSTLSTLENGEGGQLSTLLAVMRSLEVLHWLDGVQDYDQISPIQMVRESTPKRQRASSPSKSDNQNPSEW